MASCVVQVAGSAGAGMTVRAPVKPAVYENQMSAPRPFTKPSLHEAWLGPSEVAQRVLTLVTPRPIAVALAQSLLGGASAGAHPQRVWASLTQNPSQVLVQQNGSTAQTVSQQPGQ